MASYKRYRNSDGSASVVAAVHIAPFKRTARSFPTKDEAKAWAVETEKALRSQRARGADRTDLPKLMLKTLIEEFLADSDIKSLRYFSDLERLCAWWANAYGTSRVTDFGVLKLRAGRKQLEEEGEERAPATVNRYLSAMRACWNWGRSAGLIPQERGWPTRLMGKEPPGRTRYLSNVELAALTAEAEKHSPLMAAAVLVSLATGMRQGELLRLEWKDVDFKRKRIRILSVVDAETKNSESRAVHLPSVAVEALEKLRRGTVVGQRLIFFFAAKTKSKDAKSALSVQWKIVRKNAGLKNFKWHDLRHSCASFLAQNGANLLQIGSVLGHKSPSMTLRYSHLVQGDPVPAHAALDEKLRGARLPLKG
jgi:integrase